MIHFKNGYFFQEDGSRYIPLGMFANYFRTDLIGEEEGFYCEHGYSSVEFQRCTRSAWQKLFRSFAETDGATAIRMFPRGDSSGSAWEGLDIGGRLNRSLFRKIRMFMEEARPYGIKVQLALFTQPECSFYCQPDTRRYWGSRLWSQEEIEHAAPSQQRFLLAPNDLVSYEDFFTDTDVRDCCHRYLDEILPELREFEDLFAVEIYNESGWASPHADPMNTFRWENTPGFIDFQQDMVAHIRRAAPELPVAISNPGVGILGHDPIHWARDIDPDFYSLHSYPEISGIGEGLDYAAVTDATVQYTGAGKPAMLGEWQGVFSMPHNETAEMLLTLLTRDMVWLTLLSGAGGCMAWRAPGFGQYHAVKEVLELVHAPLLPDTAGEVVIHIGGAQKWFEDLWREGAAECAYPAELWCPDCAATDQGHRFCVKGKSEAFGKILQAELWSLTCGVPYRFSLTEGIDLAALTYGDFDNAEKTVQPIPGYQQKVLCADDGTTRLVYLRNFSLHRVEVVKPNGKTEAFMGRTRVAVPFTLSVLADGYTAVLYDLDTRTVVDPASIGVTDHDFILILRK